jgi:alkyl hydroperoxide reductase subunit AhpC/Tfp pilus assembly protein PilF
MSKAGTNRPAAWYALLKRDIMKKMITVAACVMTFGVLVSAPAAATLLVLQVGMQGPPFSLTTTEGGATKSTELQGKKLTVLVFWSSWIKKSEAVLARMEKLYEEFKSAGLSVVGVNVDEQRVSRQNMAAVKESGQRLKVSYPMLLDQGLTAFHDYGIIALPTTVVLDKEGIIQHELSGYPLVGAETMADFITSTMTGAQPKQAAAKPQHLPDKKALSYYNMGIASLKSKVLAEKAEPWFRKSAETDPSFLLPHLSLGQLYNARGDSTAAQAEYQAVLSREPQHPVALCELAIMLVNEGKAAEGLTMLDNARKAEESYPPCYYYTGYALGIQGKDAEAGKMFEEAEKLNPFDYKGLAYQGKLLEQKKDLKRAADTYARALEKIVHAN